MAASTNQALALKCELEMVQAISEATHAWRVFCMQGLRQTDICLASYTFLLQVKLSQEPLLSHVHDDKVGWLMIIGRNPPYTETPVRALTALTQP
jgi:hypothetical protein